MPTRISDEDFIRAFRATGTYNGTARMLDMEMQNVKRRLKYLSKKYDIPLVTTDKRSPFAAKLVIPPSKARLELTIENGVIIVFSDAHFWPKERTTANAALIKLIRELKPAAVFCNGDAFDGARVSRWPRIGWDKTPTVKDELEAVDERLGEIESVAKCRLIWNLGNHDMRFEMRLAQAAPEYEGVAGFHLKDRFPAWVPCWSTMINDNTFVKHRWHNGVHAIYNNILKSGKNMVTGHDHALDTRRWTDLNGTRYAINTGMLAEPNGDQFVNYTEDAPKSWRSGFGILTYHKGKLLPPELCEVMEFGATFRGGVI